MADASITASEVLKSTNARLDQGIAEVAITAGEALYLNEATDKLALAFSTGTAAQADMVGMAVNDAAINQAIVFQIGGTLTLGATAALTKGTTMFLSSTAGKIHPAADLASGDHRTYIGTINGSDAIVMKLHASGVQA